MANYVVFAVLIFFSHYKMYLITIRWQLSEVNNRARDDEYYRRVERIHLLITVFLDYSPPSYDHLSSFLRLKHLGPSTTTRASSEN